MYAPGEPFREREAASARRELHWHAIAAEWAYVIDGRCQTVVLDPSGASEINNYGPGAAVCCRCAARRARPSYDRARNVLASAQSPAILSAPTTIEDAVFPVGPTGKVNVRIVRLAGAKGAMAVNGSAASGCFVGVPTI
jgi:hypothetical protein